MSARHKTMRQVRQPRAHWVVLALLLPATAAALLFQGWTEHGVDGARTRLPCTEPVPAGAAHAGPVLRHVSADGADSVSPPPRTAVLTFNGGPDPVWTPRVLDLLASHDLHATFFLRGEDAARHPSLVRRIRDTGNEIGSMTYTGAAMDRASRLRARMELSLSRSVIEGTAGIRVHLLRMPLTASVDTLCGRQWDATRRASQAGWTVVAVSPWDEPNSAGVVRQFEQNATGYQQAEDLIGDGSIQRFTTVGAGVGLAGSMTPASGGQRGVGTALLVATEAGAVLVHLLDWAVLIAGGLGVLRLACLWFFARVHVRRLERERPGMPLLEEVTEPVTVLVPAYNEQDGIAATVRSLLASDYPDLRVIVIDDGSSDRTAERAAEVGDPRLLVLRQSNSGKAAALNNGLAHAETELVVMVDADTVFEPDAIRRLVQPLAHPAVGAVSGNTKVGNRRRLLGRWQHLEYVFGFNLDRRMFEVLECMPTVPGALGAYRREALLGVGGLSTDTLAEDTDLTMALWRAGWRVVYEEQAVAWTEVPVTLRQLWRQRCRWCFGTLQAMVKHRGAVRELGMAGRFARRGLSCLAVFQVLLPLLAPAMDLFALFGLLFQNAGLSLVVWFSFMGLQMLCAGYALRLDGEKLAPLWSMPLQVLVYRQLMYLVTIQSVMALLWGARPSWNRPRRSGTAAQARRRAVRVRSAA